MHIVELAIIWSILKHGVYTDWQMRRSADDVRRCVPFVSVCALCLNLNKP